MKLKQIIDAIPPLQKLSSAELSLKSLYKIKKLIDKLEPEIKFFNEKRESILSKYYDKDTQTLSDTNKNLAIVEINELLELEIDTTFEVAEIPDTENIRLSINDINALEDFVNILFSE